MYGWMDGLMMCYEWWLLLLSGKNGQSDGKWNVHRMGFRHFRTAYDTIISDWFHSLLDFSPLKILVVLAVMVRTGPPLIFIIMVVVVVVWLLLLI